MSIVFDGLSLVLADIIAVARPDSSGGYARRNSRQKRGSASLQHGRGSRRACCMMMRR